MGDNDNIGDFFRNNLNKSNNSGDAWDRPDANVWANAQAEIFTEEPTKKPYLLWLSLLGFLLISSAIGMYVWSLKKQVKTLEKTLEKQEIAIRNQEKEILNLKRKSDLSNQKHSEEIHNAKGGQIAILKEKEAVEKDLLKSQNSIFQVQKEKNDLEKQVREFTVLLEEKNAILAEKKIEDFVEKENIKLISPLMNSTNLLAVDDWIEMPGLAIPKLNQDKKSKRSQWKIGYDYSFLNLKMPANQDSKGDKKSIFNVENNVYLAPLHGLSIAYAPKENLYIRASIQKTNGKSERVWKIAQDYDKSGEYLDVDGKLTNDLTYAFNTPYAVHDGAINVTIPEETELEDKDNLFTEISDYQSFDYYKALLGAEYLIGSKKLNWQIQAGLSYNHLSFYEYFSEANVKVNGEILPIEKIEITQKSDANKSFIGLYSGVGLNYNISPHWSVGANLNYNLNLINNQKNNFSASDLLAREVGLAINYHF